MNITVVFLNKQLTYIFFFYIFITNKQLIVIHRYKLQLVQEIVKLNA